MELEVAMVGDNDDRFGCPKEIDVPMFEGFNDCHEFLVVDFIVLLC